MLRKIGLGRRCARPYLRHGVFGGWRHEDFFCAGFAKAVCGFGHDIEGPVVFDSGQNDLMREEFERAMQRCW